MQKLTRTSYFSSVIEPPPQEMTAPGGLKCLPTSAQRIGQHRALTHERGDGARRRTSNVQPALIERAGGEERRTVRLAADLDRALRDVSGALRKDPIHRWLVPSLSGHRGSVARAGTT